MRVAFFLSAAIAISGCSSDDKGNPDGGADASSDAAIDAPKDRAAQDNFTPSCAMAMACDPNDKPSLGTPACIVSLKTHVTDAMSAPLADQTIYVCGTNICTAPQKTDMMGNLTLSMCTWFQSPAYKYLGEWKYVSFASALPNMLNVDSGNVTLTPLPATGAAFPQSGDVKSGNITLTLQNATMIKFDPSESMDPENQKFRGAQVSLTSLPFFDASLGLEVLWGLAPVNAALSPPAKLTVPNVKMWPANTAVLFYLNGVDTFDAMPPTPYGKFGPIGTGHVSNDGMTVSTDPGQGNGVPMLGVVGIKKM